MTVTFLDLFDGTAGVDLSAHTPDVGTSYTLHPLGTYAEMELDGAGALRRVASTASNIAYECVGGGQSDVTIDLELGQDGANWAANVGTIFGRVGAMTTGINFEGYRLIIGPLGGAWNLRSYNGVTQTTIASGTYGNTAASDKLRLRMLGTTIQAYLIPAADPGNPVLLGGGTNSAWSSGWNGFQGTALTTDVFRSLEINSLAAASGASGGLIVGGVVG